MVAVADRGLAVFDPGLCIHGSSDGGSSFCDHLCWHCGSGQRTVYVDFVFSNTAAVGWGWRLIEGAVDLLFGVVMLAHPLLSASLIPVIVGIWVFIRGLMYLIDALKWRRSRAREWSGYAVIGVLLMVLGFLMVIDDRFGLIPVAYLLAAIFLFLGFAGLTVAFGMRRIQRDAEA